MIMLKKGLVILTSVLVCAAMYNASLLFSVDSIYAGAAESDFGSLQNDFTLSVTGDTKSSAVKVSGSRLTVGSGAESDGRVSYALTSNKSVDFSRSFTFTGNLTDTVAPDGFAIAFQPDKTYRATGRATGSGLCAYRQGGNSSYMANSLIGEIDTYDSASYGLDGDSLKAALAKRGFGGSVDSPHMALTSATGSGSEYESVKDATLIGTGTEAVSVSWQITDQKTGYGTYTMTYGEKSVSYSFYPKDVFGTTEVYMTFVGSQNFNFAGQKDKAPWTFETGTFSYSSYSNASVAIKAGVNVNGKAPEDAQTYEFVLKDADGNVLQTNESKGDNVTFDPIEFTEAGSSTYSIEQKAGSEEGITYDSDVIKVKVDVSASYDNLVAEVSYYKDNRQVTSPTFENKGETADLVITETGGSASKYVNDGEKIKYTVNVKNKGKGNAYGLWIRRYMPLYTNFYSIDKTGSYGCVDKKETASWFIKTVSPGEKISLTFTIEVNQCHPDNYQIAHKVYYEVTGSLDGPYINQETDPDNIAE